MRYHAIQIRLNEARAVVDVHLTQDRVACVFEFVRGVCGNYGNSARTYFASLVTDGQQRLSFDHEDRFDVRMSMQRRTLSGLSLHKVGANGRAVLFAVEFKGHSFEWQLADEAHIN